MQDYFFPHPRNNHHPHFFSMASIATLASIIILLEVGYVVQTKVVFLKTDFLASVLPGALVELTNQDRAISGIAGVTEDPLLNKAAAAAAEDMAANGYFAHVSPDGKTPWYWLTMVGYRYSYAGQNIAVNVTDSVDVETAWMQSPTHRANIEKPHYTRVGVGTANGLYEGRETTFVVQFFATPEVMAAASPTLAAPIFASSDWFARLLTSPSNTLTAILTVFFVIISIFFSAVLFMRGRLQHPSVVVGGVFLLLLVSGAMFASAMLTGTVVLPPINQAARVGAALP